MWCRAFCNRGSFNRLTGTHRQDRLTAVQRLDLGLFVYTHSDGMPNAFLSGAAESSVHDAKAWSPAAE